MLLFSFNLYVYSWIGLAYMLDHRWHQSSHQVKVGWFSALHVYQLRALAFPSAIADRKHTVISYNTSSPYQAAVILYCETAWLHMGGVHQTFQQEYWKAHHTKIACWLSMGSSLTLSSLYCLVLESVHSLLSKFCVVKSWMVSLSVLQYTSATIVAIKFYNLHVELPSLSANVLSTSLNNWTSVFSLMFVSMHVDLYIH